MYERIDLCIYAYLYNIYTQIRTRVCLEAHGKAARSRAALISPSSSSGVGLEWASFAKQGAHHQAHHKCEQLPLSYCFTRLQRDTHTHAHARTQVQTHKQP